MRSTRSMSTIILVGMWLGSACTSVLSNTPVSKTAEGWTLTLGEVKDGPSEYIGEGTVQVNPGDGQKLIWALLTVRSNGAQEETFNYDACYLLGDGVAHPPAVVDKHAEVNAAADRAEAFAPGQERTRQLVYTFSKDSRPTAVKCGPIALAIPAAK